MKVVTLKYKILPAVFFILIASFLVWYLFPGLTSTRPLPMRPIFPDATILGVDSNSNGVRDEVEIAISQRIKDEKIYQATLRYAAAYQKFLSVKAETREEALNLLREESCTEENIDVDYKYGLGKLSIADLTINTKERIDKAKNDVYSAVGGVLTSETYCGSKENLYSNRQRS